MHGEPEPCLTSMDAAITPTTFTWTWLSSRLGMAGRLRGAYRAKENDRDKKEDCQPLEQVALLHAVEVKPVGPQPAAHGRLKPGNAT